MRHVISALVENKSGVLAHVAGLFSSRGFNIDSLTVGRTENPGVSRMTIVVVSHDLGFVSNLVESVVCVNRRAVIHPTSEVSGQLIHEMYGGDVRMVRHSDVVCPREHVDG